MKVYVNGGLIDVEETFAGAGILSRFRPGALILGPGELPYLFCGNGSCRDCNVLAEGICDVPACRLPAFDGLRVRTGDASGQENALALAVAARPFSPREGLSGDVLVVGAGPAGRAAAEAARAAGATAILTIDARGTKTDTSPRPAWVHEKKLFCFIDGAPYALAYRATVLATGAFDAIAAFPGATLPGVFPLDVVERAVEKGFVPGRRFLLSGPVARVAPLAEVLLSRGAMEPTVLSQGETVVSVGGVTHVETARILEPRPRSSRGRRTERVVEVDAVAIAGKRAPSLELARGLGCAVRFDRGLGVDRVVADVQGRTSLPGVFVAGDALRPGSPAEAESGGAGAGRAAVAWTQAVARS